MANKNETQPMYGDVVQGTIGKIVEKKPEPRFDSHVVIDLKEVERYTTALEDCKIELEKLRGAGGADQDTTMKVLEEALEQADKGEFGPEEKHILIDKTFNFPGFIADLEKLSEIVRKAKERKV